MLLLDFWFNVLLVMMREWFLESNDSSRNPGDYKGSFWHFVGFIIFTFCSFLGIFLPWVVLVISSWCLSGRSRRAARENLHHSPSCIFSVWRGKVSCSPPSAFHGSDLVSFLCGDVFFMPFHPPYMAAAFSLFCCSVFFVSFVAALLFFSPLGFFFFYL